MSQSLYERNGHNSDPDDGRGRPDLLSSGLAAFAEEPVGIEATQPQPAETDPAILAAHGLHSALRLARSNPHNPAVQAQLQEAWLEIARHTPPLTLEHDTEPPRLPRNEHEARTMELEMREADRRLRGHLGRVIAQAELLNHPDAVAIGPMEAQAFERIRDITAYAGSRIDQALQGRRRPEEKPPLGQPERKE